MISSYTSFSCSFFVEPSLQLSAFAVVSWLAEPLRSGGLGPHPEGPMI